MVQARPTDLRTFIISITALDRKQPLLEMSSLKCLFRGLSIAFAASLTASPAVDGQGFEGIYRNGSDLAPCDSPLFCYGDMLQAIQLARPFADSKTFVDMPTKVPLEEIEAAFNKLPTPLQNGTELIEFLSTNFSPAGAELIPLVDQNITIDATLLSAMNNSVNSAFVLEIMKKWDDLTRQFNQTSICSQCQSSFIPPKRPFVVAGGRFREAYYWDSYWIVQGLLRTGGSFTDISRNQILNFLDNVAQFGFVPNGGRKYYLNRSQPPMLPQMVREYVDYTGDTSILEVALPLLIKEHAFFVQNRSVAFVVLGGNENKTYTLNRYDVENNQPRPESYREDWEQANNASFHAASGMTYGAPILSLAEKDVLYRNLASSAESGWDFTSRFLSRPREASEDAALPLRSNNIVNIVPVDLNSFLYWNQVTIARFLAMTDQPDLAEVWQDQARQRAEAMHATMWNATLNSYLDYNRTADAQEAYTARDNDALPIDTAGAPSNDTQLAFNVAQLLPFVTGAALPAIKNNPATVQRAFARVEKYLDARQGGIAPTNYRTTQQWDQPSVWPPLIQLMMDALIRTPAPADDPDWAWAHDLALRLAQRYLDSAFCTWRATGGASPSTPKLPGLNASADLGGLMFEKYSDESLNRAGGGGEYEVVVGFGWSNGVLIWVADTFRNKLATPPCAADTNNSRIVPVPPPRHRDQQGGRSAMELDPSDARWISRSCGGRAGR
ncbi:unnamed protein product [Discula destructiva]